MRIYKKTNLFILFAIQVRFIEFRLAYKYNFILRRYKSAELIITNACGWCHDVIYYAMNVARMVLN